ncbi:MAG TPA: cytochrome c [Gaiellaceae bacterium]|nr:cytochrome c [Gaiellaceae bacterium]
MPAKRLTRPAFVALLAAVTVVAAGCGAVNHITDGQVASSSPSMGQSLFVKNCAACHTLANAGTSGTVGPNLDDAFRYDKLQGIKLSTIRDVVRGQIAYATSTTGADVPGTTTPSAGMPDNILRGEQARDVAVYVAECAGVQTCGVKPAAG